MESQLEGVVVRQLSRREDARGWLVELYRSDEPIAGYNAEMSYVSVTKPGVARGPHEHKHQTDGFYFLSGKYRLVLWENRPGRPARREEFEVGVDCPAFFTVPPGVVHGYRNEGDEEAFVINCPDKLYAGPGRSEPVDEIRHEEFDSEFRF